MRGEMTQRFLARVIIVLIVIGLMIYILFEYVAGTLFNIFLPQDLTALKQYSTCALALCANGYHLDGTPSGEVNAVGCLKYEGGRCSLTCANMTEVFAEKGINGQQQGDRRVFCGKESKLDFQFTGVSLGGSVPLASGQMDRIANPAWLCKPVKIANFFVDDLFGNPPGLNTADFWYHLTDQCIMLAKVSEVPVTTIANLFAPEDQRYSGGCFTGLVFGTKEGIEELYTPILEYSAQQEKIHPSGIYLDQKDSFTSTLSGRSKPECQLENPRQEFVITDDDIKRIAEKNKDRLFDRIRPETCTGPVSVENCEVEKVTFDELSDAEKEKVARLILKEEFGDIEFVDDLQNCPKGKKCQQFEPTAIPQNTLGDRISRCEFLTTYKNEKITYSVYAEDTLPTPFALFGSCKTVTLDRNLESVDVMETVEEQETEELTVTVSIEKSEYMVGETVIVTGTVKGDTSDGRRFSTSEKTEVSYLNTRINFAAIDRVDVIGGKFESEFHIRDEILRGATFQVSAEYEDMKSNVVEFVVK